MLDSHLVPDDKLEQVNIEREPFYLFQVEISSFSEEKTKTEDYLYAIDWQNVERRLLNLLTVQIATFCHQQTPRWADFEIDLFPL